MGKADGDDSIIFINSFFSGGGQGPPPASCYDNERPIYQEGRDGKLLLLLFRGQGQSPPPPDNFSVFFSETEQFSGGFRRDVNQIENFAAVFRRGCGGLKIPIEVGLFERADVEVTDREAGGLA